MSSVSDAVRISEVGPRDGLQSVARTMPTAAKCRWIDALAAAGLREIEVGLSDTTDMANPAQVRRLFRRLHAELGARAGAAHLHNTRGLGPPNGLAAFDVGVRSFDASLADGLPGEPPYGMTPEAGLPLSITRGPMHG